MAPGSLELGFNVNAGPLSQISVQVVGLETAVQLATGVYGWWKARERCESLESLLSVAGGHLVPSSTFNSQQYQRARQNHHVMGTFVQDRELQTAVCPKASTALPSDPGLTCMRALTSSLLCLYSVDATVKILAEVLPLCLIQHHQEDSVLSFTGPLLSNLKASISAIAAEEDSNTFRSWLNQQVGDAEARLFQRPGAAKILQKAPAESADTWFSIAMLKWALTSIHRREMSSYVTRSLIVWSLAVLLNATGFDITASLNLMASQGDVEDHRASGGTPTYGLADVKLCIHPDFDADPYLTTTFNDVRQDELKTQITSVQTIPYAAFKHVRYQRGDEAVRYLTDVFAFVYENVRRMSIRVSARDGANITFSTSEQPGQPQFPIGPLPKSILTRLSPHLARCPEICRAVKEFIPASHSDAVNPSWNEEKIMSFLERWSSGTMDGDKAETEIQESTQIIQAIMLAVAYGLISHFVKDSTGQVSDLSEVAFPTQIMKWGRLPIIIAKLGLLLQPNMGIPHHELCGVINELILGRLSRPSTGQDHMQGAPHRMVVAMQANGMTVVSDLVVRPTRDPRTLSLFHLAPGQILNLPVQDDGYVVLYSNDGPQLMMGEKDRVEDGILAPFEDEQNRAGYRVDAEPYWEQDPRTVVFRLRRNGVETACLSSPMLWHNLRTLAPTPCSCGQFLDRFKPVVPSQGRRRPEWLRFRLERLFPGVFGFTGVGSFSSWRNSVAPTERRLIDVRGSEPLQFAILGTLLCRHTVLTDGCLECAYNALPSDNRQNEGMAIIILK